MQPVKKKVVVCPLDWGLGHATRMIPVIYRYLNDGYQVVLGGSGKSGDLLRACFPELLFMTIPSPAVRYASRSFWLIPVVLIQFPGMILSAIREHRLIKKIIEEHQVDIVISDNRYGLFCKMAYSIFVTHQISPVLPRFLYWAEYPVYRIIRWIIEHFNECWIPDDPDHEKNLSGKLSHRFRLPRNTRYIGILSRFTALRSEKKPEIIEVFELVFILSGPEPQLGLFFELCVSLAMKIRRKILIITGLHTVSPFFKNPAYAHITLASHLDPLQFVQVLLNARAIICRSGYSGIMDLVTLGRTALLVPTPGQPEQEYLAEYLSLKGSFTRALQRELNEDSIQNYLERQPIVK